MPNRARDWPAQAQRDLALARHAAHSAFHEWARFAAQQAAEKADAERIIDYCARHVS